MTASGTCARWRRAASSAHAFGRNRRALTGQCSGVLVSGASSTYSALTTTWQLATLPTVPEYCGATPTEPVPFLGSPVSSTTSTPPGGLSATSCAHPRLRPAPRAPSRRP